MGALSLVVCAGLIWAPAALAGHADNYSGTFDQGPSGGPTYEIDFTVGKTKRNGKLVPKFVRSLRTRGLLEHCPDGQSVYGSDGGANGFAHYATDIAVKKNRTFHAHANIDGTTWTVTGRIPRSGPATGTVRQAVQIPEEGGLCDSGVVTWTAPKA